MGDLDASSFADKTWSSRRCFRNGHVLQRLNNLIFPVVYERAKKKKRKKNCIVREMALKH